ncbi:hypothetical protein [Candidatus Nitrotoga sp. M5]|uniref:hypothetical protein n=1 Tax=Candidatus Nitrotoga sp. M5 TaxID=2890409 RepID=UPI001EF1E5FD|nr:hypothetical protein [Candidatus Nitrotoga sp. M5]CAH1386351.1 exported hypothetical protein [Candidatus Nitrotoga sp. M5]
MHSLFIRLFILLSLISPSLVLAATVVEFYNTNLDNYFITSDAGESASIDNGSAGPGWSRTGNTFESGGNASVCRFYGSQSPGPNSHFYTVDSEECQGLKDQQIAIGDPRKLTVKSWNFESLDFVSTPATNQACPSGTTPVYRAYNNGFTRGVDSNHRITTNLTSIQQVEACGWSNEGVVMCAPSGTTSGGETSCPPPSDGDNSTNNTSGSSTPTNIEFKFFPANYFTTYDVFTTLTGSDNHGNTYTGNTSDKTLTTSTFLGKNTIPIESKINFTVSHGGFAAVTQNQYFGINASDRRFLGVDGDVATVSATTNTIPITAKIGDSGTSGIYTDKDGFVSTITWQLSDGLNGNAKLVISNTTNDQFGSLDNTFTTTYIISTDGTRKSVEFKTFNMNVNLEVTLRGVY